MGHRLLDERQAEDIQMMAEIVNAMVIADGFQSLDSCLDKHPDRLDTYTRYASAALRAVRYVQGFPIQIIIDDSEENEAETDNPFNDGMKL